MAPLLFDFDAIWKMHLRNLKQAKDKLAELEVYCNKPPMFGGLSGWIFEQTIQTCLRKELEAFGCHPEFQEDIRIGRKRADLGIDNLIAVEIKSAGLFSKEEAERYGKYKVSAAQNGLEYLFLTSGEHCAVYRHGIIEAVGTENVFFLDDIKDWGRFVARITELLTLRGRAKNTSRDRLIVQN